MKIGIITLVLNENYGGIMQAYALQTILKRQGHDVTHIDRIREFKIPSHKRFFVYIKRFFQKHIMRKDIVVCPDLKVKKELRIISQHTRPFIDSHISRKFTTDYSDIKEHEFDAIVVGSDQIWRPSACKPNITQGFLSFAQNWDIKRIAYAASFGTDTWEYTKEETKLCSRLAKKFNAISVREYSGAKLCKENLGVEAVHLLDPTMLLDKEDYIKLFKDANTPQSNGKLFCYILDPNIHKQEIIDRIATIKNIEPFYVNSRYQDESAPLRDRIQPAVETWLRGFYDADYVITDSFHACVFSIIFNKPFIAYGNIRRGMTRFESLLETFNLKERLIFNSKKIEKIIDKDINWEQINQNINTLKAISTSFLIKNLQV